MRGGGIAWKRKRQPKRGKEVTIVLTISGIAMQPHFRRQAEKTSQPYPDAETLDSDKYHQNPMV